MCQLIKKHTQKDSSPEGQRIQRIASELSETRQRCHELLMTLLTVKLRAQE